MRDVEEPGQEFPDFEMLFSIENMQALQDEFSSATGVASIITRIDGSPITRPSNFCRLCRDLIRGNEKGAKKCRLSDAKIGKFSATGPTVQRCQSCGL